VQVVATGGWATSVGTEDEECSDARCHRERKKINSKDSTIFVDEYYRAQTPVS
jgi:hypothetical protein